MKPSDPIKVLMAPDWRGHNPYLVELARALARLDHEVVFPTGTRRVAPITRLVGDLRPDVLHLHWPEAFWPADGALHRWVQLRRFPFDVALASRRCVLVLTAHNFYPHDTRPDAVLRAALAGLHRCCHAVIAHSPTAARELSRAHPCLDGRLHVVPHGDLAPVIPPDRGEARRRLGHDKAKIVLMFGVIQPYKGIWEIARLWADCPADWCLRIVGDTPDAGYLEAIRRAAPPGRVIIRAGRLDDAALAEEIVAADATLFNYRRIFTSGAACLARSLGVPVVLPASCGTVDLAEPSPAVFRFAGDDPRGALREALAARPLFADTAAWRADTAWSRVGAMTSEVYRKALGIAKKPCVV